jgi:hypothetical protein
MLRRTILPLERAMPETSEPIPFAETFAKPEAMMRVPVGLSSPLWGLFAGAAIGGSAWWWMTRWSRAENLEALFGAAALPAPEASVAEVVVEAVVVEAVAEIEAAPAAEAEPVVEAAPMADPVVEAAAEPAPEPIAEAAPEPIAEPEPAPEPKPRARKAEAKAD